MEILFLLVIVLILFVPQFFLMRKQRAARDRIMQFQESLGPGQRVVTAGGIHLTILTIGEDTVEGEVAPGVSIEFDRSSILRKDETSDETPAVQERDEEDPYSSTQDFD